MKNIFLAVGLLLSPIAFAGGGPTLPGPCGAGEQSVVLKSCNNALVNMVNPALIAQLPARDRASIAPFLVNGNSYGTYGCGGVADFGQVSGPGFIHGGLLTAYDSQGSALVDRINWSSGIEEPSPSASDIVVRLAGKTGITLHYSTVEKGGLQFHEAKLADFRCE